MSSYHFAALAGRGQRHSFPTVRSAFSTSRRYQVPGTNYQLFSVYPCIATVLYHPIDYYLVPGKVPGTVPGTASYPGTVPAGRSSSFSFSTPLRKPDFLDTHRLFIVLKSKESSY